MAGGSSCSPYAFESTWSRVRMAINVLFFLVYVIQSCIAITRFSRNRNKGRAMLRWSPLTISMGFSLLSTLFYCTFVAVTQCELGYSPTIKQILAFLAVHWFYNLSEYFLVFAVMIPVVRHVHRFVGAEICKVTTICHIIYLAVLTVIDACDLGIDTAIRYASATASDAESNSVWYQLIGPWRAFMVTFYVLEIVGMISAAITMFRLLASQPPGSRKDPVLRVVLLLVGAIGMPLTSMADSIQVSFPIHGEVDESYSIKAGSAAAFMESFFYACAFCGAYLIAGLQKPIPDPVADTTCYSYVPNEMKPPPQQEPWQPVPPWQPQEMWQSQPPHQPTQEVQEMWQPPPPSPKKLYQPPQEMWQPSSPSPQHKILHQTPPPQFSPSPPQSSWPQSPTSTFGDVSSPSRQSQPPYPQDQAQWWPEPHHQ